MAAKKINFPANDRRMDETQKISCVILRRPLRHRKYIVAGVSVFFVVFFLVAVFVASQTADPAKTSQPVATVKSERSEPFDIVLGETGAELLGEETAFASQDSSQSEASSLQISVEGELDGLGSDAGETKAGRLAVLAQKFFRANMVAQAVKHQRNAVRLEPDNMLYRLQLAIMLDRGLDGRGAASLYAEVIDAYDGADDTLPLGLDIDSIRARHDYLLKARR